MPNERSLDYQRIKSVLSVRNEILKATRAWFESKEFLEVQGPIIVPAIGESCSFVIDYFGHKACLTGGLQPYGDAFSDMFEKIFSVSPVFREERLQSNRHLAEFWRIEASMIDQSFDKMLECQEQLISHICQHLIKRVRDELSVLSCNLEKIKNIQPPFPRLTYDQAIEKLKKTSICISWGEGLDLSAQNSLSLLFDKPFFITHFPICSDTLLFKSPKADPHLTLSVDLLAPEGYGEIASGGESINSKKELINKLKGLDLKKEELDWYLTLKHPRAKSGFAIGIERLLVWICHLKSVEDANLFTRSFWRKFV